MSDITIYFIVLIRWRENWIKKNKSERALGRYIRPIFMSHSLLYSVLKLAVSKRTRNTQMGRYTLVSVTLSSRGPGR